MDYQFKLSPRLLVIGFLSVSAYGWGASALDGESLPPASLRFVSFEQNIQPILAERCLSCHGPSKQKSGLRLDDREHALKGGNNGAALIPGDSTQSTLIRYVSGLDADIVMPPEGDPLTSEQVGLLRAWIDAGASWSANRTESPTQAGLPTPRTDHWAFKCPVHPEPPPVRNTGWPRNPIDTWILAKQEQEGLTPSPEADRYTLIRRVSLDLTGLPPTPEEAGQFALDSSPDAYEKAVDRLLASPHFGERWARHWLDLARYADTNGYEKDRKRSIWPYRDWVIDALNADMPFNQFAIEQIAGDMLPNASLSQMVATGFHRNTMINEEGGIDVEEFRYESIVDRMKTTATVFLGLTMNCCQCHDHKYDPFTQREYFQMFAFLNNADEPEMEVPTASDLEKKDAILAKIHEKEDQLEQEFPPFEDYREWVVLEPAHYCSTGGAVLTRLEDQSILAIGDNPDEATYQLIVENPPGSIDAIRLEALSEPRLKTPGPGRTPHGNFVLSEFKVAVCRLDGTSAACEVTISTAEADFSQEGFPVSATIDGNPATGWAVDDGSKDLDKDRSAIFVLRDRLDVGAGSNLAITLAQRYGGKHTLGRFRISAAKTERLHHHPGLPLAEQRRLHLEAKMTAWEEKHRPAARHWVELDPISFTSENHATLTKLEDLSILATGDKPNRDTYRMKYMTHLRGITALRLETLPHETLPYQGPGRGNVMGKGDFMLSEVNLAVRPLNHSKIVSTTLEWSTASDSPGSSPKNTVEKAIDGISDTGWGVTEGGGISHTAVFELKSPTGEETGTELSLVLDQRHIHQSTIGRFRVAVTTDPAPVRATGLPGEIEAVLLIPKEERTVGQTAHIRKHFLSISPDLDKQHKTITELRGSLPEIPTSLVMQERSDPRLTHVHIRGEFLREGIAVSPAVPAVLHPFPEGQPCNRLTFAKWLVDETNPLIGRVTMNRLWQSYFGRGLVFTSENFGVQGDPPSHPELLDWLATEFIRRGWSLKAMHRLIVTSATYRQSSRTSGELLARDPNNIQLARGPRFRIESEMVRDIALAASGLLNAEIGGPSVFPPQPAGVTELAYGSPKWPASVGKDRYRRALYTHLKRTALYPGLTVFDTPAPDSVCTRRVRSNTPLQALTVLNDEVYVEAAQALAKHVLEDGPSDIEGKVAYAFRRCLVRPPLPKEVEQLSDFYRRQLDQFRGEPERATLVAFHDPSNAPEGTDACEAAAWSAVSRVLLNLDETLTKE